MKYAIPKPYVPTNKVERVIGIFWNYAIPAVMFYTAGFYKENPISILLFIFGMVSIIVRVHIE